MVATAIPIAEPKQRSFWSDCKSLGQKVAVGIGGYALFEIAKDFAVWTMPVVLKALQVLAATNIELFVLMLLAMAAMYVLRDRTTVAS